MDEAAADVLPAMISLDGEDLLLAAQRDRQHFAAVFEAYHLPVYRYVRSLVDTDDEAGDLTAAAFERALRSLSGYRGGGSPVGWLLRIARNITIDARRTRHFVVPLDERTGGDLVTEAPDMAVLAYERIVELRLQIRALPEAAREAIALRYGSRLPVREIAPLIGKSEAATQKLITRALATLREADDA
jgi:RNA polymerase sigma-70 factor (ECF subfamily)